MSSRRMHQGENLRFPPTFRVTQPDGLFHRQSNGFAVVGDAAVPGVGYGFTIEGKAASNRWTQVNVTVTGNAFCQITKTAHDFRSSRYAFRRTGYPSGIGRHRQYKPCIFRYIVTVIFQHKVKSGGTAFGNTGSGCLKGSQCHIRIARGWRRRRRCCGNRHAKCLRVAQAFAVSHFHAEAGCAGG